MKNSEIRNGLAVHLIRNHLQHLRLDKAACKEIVADDVMDDFRLSRVVVVVGAGASNYSGAPLGNKAIKKIVKSASMPPKMFDAELKRLTLMYKLPSRTLETTLMALCSNPYIQKLTKEKIQELYDFRYVPSLCYELLAHLLKHRFVDAIINFNFDELLDQAIEDELEKEEFHFILSDGDCPDSSEMINPILEKPFYIKPHGTVSHQSTLRFTNEDYFSLPLGITNLIEQLINTDHELVLIIIGFKMQSFEFNNILENAKKKSIMYILNFNKIPIARKLKNFFEIKLIKVDRQKGLTAVMDSLWKDIESIFKKGYEPRTISRHRFISTLFKSGPFRDTKVYKEKLSEYFLQRTIIEICLAAAKCKGIINIAELSRGKSGKYYDKYRNLSNEKSKETFYEICMSLGFIDIGYSHEVLRLKENGYNRDESILPKHKFIAALGHLYEEAKKRVPHLIDRLPKFQSYGYFKGKMLDLYESDEVEIKIIPEPIHTKIFKNPTIILTKSALSYYTYKILNDSNCEHIWIVAETGAWLTNSLFQKYFYEKKDKVRISLIVADSTWKETLIYRCKDSLKEMYKIPWWKHNRHMTIVLDSNQEPISSIYFARRLKNSHITPVLLNKVDTKFIIDAFESYKNKARKILY